MEEITGNDIGVPQEIVEIDEVGAGERLLKLAYMGLLAAVVIALALIVYSLISSPSAPRTKAERDIMYYSDLAKKNPKDARTHMGLGRAYFDAGKFSDAVGVFREVLKIDPKMLDAKQAIGVSYQQMGDLDQAIKTLEEYVKARPKDALGLVSLANANFDKGNYNRALELAKKVQDVSPADVDAYYLVGQIYEKQGKKALAKTEYQKILRYDPESTEAKSAIERLGN